MGFWNNSNIEMNKGFSMLKTKRMGVNRVKSYWASAVVVSHRTPFLGPLLFSLYINDISADFESEIRLFAEYCVYYRE